MTNISRKIAAFTLAGTLILPTTAGVAQAQSSFGSSSAGDEYSNNTGSKSNRLERAIEAALVANGQVIGKASEAQAEAVLKHAIDNDLYFIDNVYEEESYNPPSATYVLRLTPEQVDVALDQLDSEGLPLNEVPAEFEGFSAPFGVAVGKNSDYYFLVMSITIG